MARINRISLVARLFFTFVIIAASGCSSTPQDGTWSTTGTVLIETNSVSAQPKTVLQTIEEEYMTPEEAARELLQEELTTKRFIAKRVHLELLNQVGHANSIEELLELAQQVDRQYARLRQPAQTEQALTMDSFIAWFCYGPFMSMR